MGMVRNRSLETGIMKNREAANPVGRHGRRMTAAAGKAAMEADTAEAAGADSVMTINRRIFPFQIPEKGV